MTTKQQLFALSFGACLALGAASIHAAEDTPPDGAQLYVGKACLSCHGVDGRTPILPIYPKIAGQNAGYLFNQMRDIKGGTRNNGQSVVMLGILAAVNEEEMRAIADWLATQ